ncbi:MAG: hypothetical protein JWN47_314 [Frankiales bacterium]|nr:hypothetical protein [Frankiales bacterium]
MPTFIAFLRAVNVGKRQYPMAELRAALTEAGFEDVETHIQTGNVRVTTSMRSKEKVRAALEKAMKADRGFDVSAIVLTPAELLEVYDDAQRFAADHTGTSTGHYVSLLQATATAKDISAFETRDIPGEHVRVGKRAGHLLLSKAYHEARTGNDVFEKTFGPATNRNMTVITKLVEKWTD